MKKLLSALVVAGIFFYPVAIFARGGGGHGGSHAVLVMAAEATVQGATVPVTALIPVVSVTIQNVLGSLWHR